MQFQRIGVIGYGEVGKTFALGLRPRVDGMAAWDLKFAQPQHHATQQAHAAQHGVVAAEGMAALCAQAELLISAVTASNTLGVAEAAAAHLRPGTGCRCSRVRLR